MATNRRRIIRDLRRGAQMAWDRGMRVELTPDGVSIIHESCRDPECDCAIEVAVGFQHLGRAEEFEETAMRAAIEHISDLAAGQAAGEPEEAEPAAPVVH